jgi:multimeric flavodoxin WrbA
MKVVAFNGSGRKDGNTAVLLRNVLAELENEGIKTELIQLAGKPIHGCIACYKCVTMKNKRCAIENDALNEFVAKMDEADGIIIGSPTYFADCSSQTRALIERAGFVSRANGNLLKRKIGAAVVAVRRAGAIHAFNSINHLFTISQMIIAGSSYWNIGVCRDIGEAEKDDEGIETMSTLGKNMAWLLKKIHG